MPISLGPFDLGELLGVGGMGEVWAATHRTRKLPVAIKVLHHQRATTPRGRARSRREIQITARLSHPNIIQLFDQGVISEENEAQSAGRLVAGGHYLVMERAHLGSLQHAAPGAWSDVRDVLLALLRALQHAHARGIVHRDLKPSNVLLIDASAPARALRLADFGIAWLREGEVRADHAGTRPYMAPEQLHAQWRDLGPWTDLYALGCLAWTLLCGAPPFAGDDLRTSLPRFTPRFPVPEGLIGWLAALLAPAPENRPQLAADAAWTLGALSERSGVAVAPIALPDIATMADADPEPAPACMPAPSRPRRIAPAPQSWRVPTTSSRAAFLPDAGLGLVGLREPELIGRLPERDQLWSTLLSVRQSGRPTAIVLRGPAGVGKSRLSAWVSQTAHALGVATPLVVRHTATTDTLSETLARHLGCAGLSRVEVEQRLQRRFPGADAEQLASLIQPQSNARSFASPLERRAVVVEFLRWRTAERPILLWLDDVHESLESLALVESILEQEELPVLCVLTIRDESLVERPEAVERLAALDAHPVRTIALGAMSEMESAELIHQMLTLDASLAAKLWARGQGNPLLTLLLLQSWTAQLVPSSTGFVLDSTALDDDDAPWGSQRGAWAALGVGDGEAVALELAAAMGPVLRESDWQALCAEQGAPDPTPLLDRLLARQLMLPADAPGHWRLAHPMLQEAIRVHAQRAGRWARHHRACAAFLLRAQQADPERLGHHFLLGERPGLAHTPLLEAARMRSREGRHQAALSLLAAWGEAAEQSGALSAAEQTAGLELQARILYEQGRFAQAEPLARRASAGPVSCPERAGAMSILASCVGNRGDREGAQAIISATIAAAEVSGNAHIAIRARVMMSTNLHEGGEPVRAARWLQEALSMPVCSRATRSAAGYAWLVFARRCAQQGQRREARRAFQQALDWYTGPGQHNARAWCLAGLGGLNSDIAMQQQAVELQRRIGNRYGMAHALTNIAWAHQEAGRLDEAEETARRAVVIFERIGSWLQHVACIVLAVIDLQRARPAHARVRLSALLKTFKSLKQTSLIGITHALLVCCPIPEASQWAHHMREGERLLQQTGRAEGWLALLLERTGERLAQQGDDARAARVRALAADQRRRLSPSDEAR